MSKSYIHIFISICIGGALAVACSADFREQEVTVYNNEGNITLGATLTAPRVPKAGIVLATGSGPQNRDEEIGGHKPFKLIAEYLSKRGYAVLRMDDRGVDKSTGDFGSAVNDNFVSDIAAGISYLDSCYNDIPIGVIGHSEGGHDSHKICCQKRELRFYNNFGRRGMAGRLDNHVAIQSHRYCRHRPMGCRTVSAQMS
jgi:predicted alpha/beta hydrolase